MIGKEFEQIIRISFERKKFTNLIIDKKLFRNFAHVYCKSAVHPGKFHYTCTMIDMRDKPTLEVRQADVDLAVWDDQGCACLECRAFSRSSWRSYSSLQPQAPQI